MAVRDDGAPVCILPIGGQLGAGQRDEARKAENEQESLSLVRRYFRAFPQVAAAVLTESGVQAGASHRRLNRRLGRFRQAAQKSMVNP